MAIQLIPTEAYPDRTQETRLGGRRYLMRFRWNARNESWHMDMSTPAGAVIVRGVRLALSSRPIYGVVHDDRPPGELFVIDRTGSGVEATLEDFGTRVQLMYSDGEA